LNTTSRPPPGDAILIGLATGQYRPPTYSTLCHIKDRRLNKQRRDFADVSACCFARE
jgi:hypothetical protein